LETNQIRFEPITCENSTVDGSEWSEERFAALDFSGELFSDSGYPMGCLKYVPCAMDSDPSAGHRVRSRCPDAKPVKVDGKWLWQVSSIITP
jgi:hypothetical protein